MPTSIQLSGRFLGYQESKTSKRTYEPQRQNAGYLLLPDIYKIQDGFTPQFYELNSQTVQEVLALSIESLRLPMYGTETIQMGYFNEFVAVAGKSVIDDVDLVVKDFVDIPTVRLLEYWFLRVYNPAIGAMGKAYQFKKNAHAVLYATDGSDMRWYTLEGCFISRFARGDIDQNASDVVRVTATLSVDRIIPNVINNPVNAGGLQTLPGGNAPVELAILGLT